MKSDYGTYLISQGQTNETLHAFQAVPVPKIDLLDASTFSVSLGMGDYAATFDFPSTLFEAVFELATQEAQLEMQDQLSDGKRPSALILSAPFWIGLKARLGPPQEAEGGESFVPLLVESITEAVKGDEDTLQRP